MSPLLPDYTIRESARAKHVRFRVTPADGLEVVIPKGFDRGRIPGMLEEKRDWLDRALRQMASHRAALLPTDLRPMTIEFPAIGQTWRLSWSETTKANVSISAIGPFRLRLSGSIQDQALWRSALRQWLIERAREHLIPWTEDLSQERGIQIQRVSIRCQKTRWGSYSTRNDRMGAISLNAQLLFLPERLVCYVISHELCHAVHPDHSPRFWNLLRTHEPDTDRLRAELRDAWQRVPGWIHQTG